MPVYTDRHGQRQAGRAAEHLPPAGQQHRGGGRRGARGNRRDPQGRCPRASSCSRSTISRSSCSDSIDSVRDAILIGLDSGVASSWCCSCATGARSLVAGLVIPATIAITFIALRVMGESFNLMTLGGLAAAVGLVIDDAIVVVENIVMHRDSGQSARRSHPQRHARNPRAAGRIHHHADRGLPAADLHHRRDRHVLPRAGGHGGRGAAHLAGAGAHLDADAQPLFPAPQGRADGRTGEHACRRPAACASTSARCASRWSIRWSLALFALRR